MKKKLRSKIGSFPAGSLAVLPGVLVALISFGLYLATLAPTALPRDVNAGLADAGLFQVRVYILGIPNPTGYPTYLLLGKLFTYLPVGDVGYRVNLASAVYAAVAVLLLFFLLRVLTGRTLPAAAAALLFGVSRAFWSQAVIAEVYTLNVMFVCLVCLPLLLWRKRGQDRYLLLAAFLMGLSLTNHLTSGLLIPAGLVFVGLTDRRKLLDWRLALKAAALFVAGLTPYIYLPVRAMTHPPLSGYHPASLDGFFSFVTGSSFQGQMFVYGPAQIPWRLEFYLSHLLHQFPPVFLVVAAFGFWYMLFTDRAAAVFFGILYAGWLVFALEYAIPDVWVYFIPTYLVICVFVASGLVALFEMGAHLSRRWRASRHLSSTRRLAAKGALGFLVLAAPLAGVQETYRVVDHSDYYQARKTMDLVARDVPRGATVITNGSSLWYMKLVDHRRTDLRIVSPFLNPEDWSQQAKPWVRLSEKYLREGQDVYVLLPGDRDGYYMSYFEQSGLRLSPRDDGAFYRVEEDGGGG